MDNPALMAPAEKRDFISLSGGGFRAAFYHAGALRVFHEAQRLDGHTFINCVSGGALAAVIWEMYLSTKKAFQIEYDDFPERVLIELMRGTPKFGGRYNWLKGRIPFIKTWREHLREWETGLLEKIGDDYIPNLSMGVKPAVFYETVDILQGKVFVFSNGNIVEPTYNFFKEGSPMKAQGMARSDALAACTAFPGYFRALRIKDFNLQLLDAGFIDNIAMFPFLKLLDKKANSGPLIRPADSWYISSAGKRLKAQKLGALSWSDGAFRLAGDVGQAVVEPALQKLISDNYTFKISGMMIGILPYGASPWITTKNLTEPIDVAEVETALCPVDTNDAVAIMAQGAQTASGALGLSASQQDVIKARFEALLVPA